MTSGKPTQPCSHDGSSRKEVISIADKKFRGRDKIVQKMTKDGLVDENLRTGEQKSATAAEKPEQEDSAKETAEKETDKEPVMDEICMDAGDGEEDVPRHHSTAKQSADYYKAHQEDGKPKDASAESDAEPPTKKGRLSFEDEKGGIVRGMGMGVKKVTKKGVDTATGFAHQKVHQVEKDNSGVEGAHKSEELAERGARYGTRKLKQGYRSHKLKPYREAAKAEKAAFKANVNFQYHKTLHDNPQLTSNPLSRFMQKQQIKRQYAKAAKKGGAKAAAEATRKTAKKTAEETRKAAAFAARHPAGILIAVAALLLFIMISAGLSSCGAMFSGLTNGVLGTSYTSEDSDLVAVENNYAALENGLQSEIDNIESTHPGYDEYRYDLDSIGHNPHELASYLTALLQSYTPQSAQAELERIFSMQYTLTLTEEVEIRYRTETSTDPETGETTTEEVPYEYHILNVKLTNKPISELAEELLTPQQLEMYRVYLETSGNKPLIFGGGSPDGSPSEDLSGVEFVNGTRPGNQELMELAKQQVGNVGGYPYWSWYGFNSRVEWCACFVSWCYNQAGKSEPRFAGCEWQGVPWFQSRGQWGARGYENIAPGDAIFFDWDLDGVADHVGLVLGRDGSRVYTVEGNSGDACKIKSYDLNYQCIKGYGLMNW